MEHQWRRFAFTHHLCSIVEKLVEAQNSVRNGHNFQEYSVKSRKVTKDKNFRRGQKEARSAKVQPGPKIQKWRPMGNIKGHSRSYNAVQTSQGFQLLIIVPSFDQSSNLDALPRKPHSQFGGRKANSCLRDALHQPLPRKQVNTWGRMTFEYTHSISSTN